MKNLNELYLKNMEEKRIKAEEEHKILKNQLLNDIKAFTYSKSFLEKAESMLSDKGCLKIDHRLIYRNNTIYTVTEKHSFCNATFPKDTSCSQLSLGSEEGQKLIGDDFVKFWEDQGVRVIFVFGYMILVVDTLWEKMENHHKTTSSRRNNKETNYLPLEMRIEKMADRLDASKWMNRPFCCFE